MVFLQFYGKITGGHFHVALAFGYSVGHVFFEAGTGCSSNKFVRNQGWVGLVVPFKYRAISLFKTSVSQADGGKIAADIADVGVLEFFDRDDGIVIKNVVDGKCAICAAVEFECNFANGALSVASEPGVALSVCFLFLFKFSS